MAMSERRAREEGRRGRTLQTGGGARGGADGTAKTPPQERCGRRKPQQGPPLRIQNRNFAPVMGRRTGKLRPAQNFRRDGYGRC